MFVSSGVNVAVIVAVPKSLIVTLPVSSTVATSVASLSYLMVPATLAVSEAA